FLNLLIDLIFKCEEATEIMIDEKTPIEKLFQPIEQVIMFNWQRSGSLKRFFRILHSANEGRGVRKNHDEMVRLNRWMRWYRNFMILYSLFFTVYFISGIRPYGMDWHLVTRILYFERLLIVYVLTLSYLLIGWSIQLHIYCFCIRAALCEIRQFINDAVEMKCASEKEAIAFFTESIQRNVRLSLAVRHLDEILKRFAFFEIAIIIPCTLFVTFATIMKRKAPMIEFIPNVVLVFMCILLFHVLTISPARLQNQVKKTRSVFCSNIRQWIPYGQSVHTAALVFSSHLGQNDIGVTLWGFALLSKPLILTSLSAMMTSLAIFLQFSDCKKKLDEVHGFPNSTTID
ncbi:hypothetical protein PFISCL1PPCAC_6832, partial [Pristionchus fissidentatus]